MSTQIINGAATEIDHYPALRAALEAGPGVVTDPVLMLEVTGEQLMLGGWNFFKHFAPGWIGEIRRARPVAERFDILYRGYSHDLRSYFEACDIAAWSSDAEELTHSGNMSAIPLGTVMYCAYCAMSRLVDYQDLTPSERKGSEFYLLR